jgi:glycerol-3-phosphate dehydrogenase subunit C
VFAGQIKQIVDACTLCDMCFMVKCPYVPPHEFNLDFPHLMLRYRAAEHRKGMTSKADTAARRDRSQRQARQRAVAPVANWASDAQRARRRAA